MCIRDSQYPIHYVGNPTVDEVAAYQAAHPKNKEHFIFYGSWSEASMFEPVSITEYMYGSPKVPYSGTYTNNLVVKFDE